MHTHKNATPVVDIIECAVTATVVVIAAAAKKSSRKNRIKDKTMAFYIFLPYCLFSEHFLALRHARGGQLRDHKIKKKKRGIASNILCGRALLTR